MCVDREKEEYLTSCNYPKGELSEMFTEIEQVTKVYVLLRQYRQLFREHIKGSNCPIHNQQSQVNPYVIGT